MEVGILIFLVLSLSVALVVRNIRQSRMNRWLGAYLKRPRLAIKRGSEPVHLHIAFCNRMSPYWGGVSQEIAEHRIVTWCREYTRFASHFADTHGRKPVHTFFYDESDYNPRFLDTLSRMCREGLADVEMLIRHESDSAEGFRRKLEGFRDVLFHHHGLLRKNSEDKIAYGFIHARGALNNCRPDGRFCGVNGESLILKQTGCYADFTYPTAPDLTQPPIINSIYFTSGSVDFPASHERGTPVSMDNWNDRDLMIIQGPIGFNWGNRRYGLFPRLENSEISYRRRFSRSRAKLWVESAIQVKGAPNHVFIKLHTFGAVDSTVRYLFGESGIYDLYRCLETDFGQSGKYRLHYVSAFELYNTVRALCQQSPALHDQHLIS